LSNDFFLSIARRCGALALGLTFITPLTLAQDEGGGRRLFEARCATCHGADANGGEFGPSILARLPQHTDDDLTGLISNGLPARGMPGSALGRNELTQLVTYLRTLRAGPVPERMKVSLLDGQVLDGVVNARGQADLQIRTNDGRIHLLRKHGDKFREVSSESDWPTYNGLPSGNRYSALKQITRTNLGQLRASWIYSMPDTSPLQTTPLVVQGIMYVTSANQCHALDAGNGRPIWDFTRPRTKGVIGNAAGGINRGAAVAGDRLFMVTDDAHLLAFDRFNGKLIWESPMADWRQNYAATAAPLVVGDLVIAGVAGGDAGARGFVGAWDQSDGKERWRFWTTPLPGEPGSETWKGKTIEHAGAATWMTGTYDPELETIYWPTGNPGNDHNGDEREGDNLYSCSIVALNAKTGKMKWFYQYTPHDLWDWDAQEPPVLVDTEWHGQRRKLLLNANRNGFFYVLDRTNGKLLLVKPFVQKLTWAREVGPDGKPVKNPDQEPSAKGVKVCPSLIGAANWWSTAFVPPTGLYYVQALESCSIYTKKTAEWQAGRGFSGGSVRNAPNEPPKRFLRAIDIQSGKIAWELSEDGPGTGRGGVLATASGLLFFCNDANEFMAADAMDGKLLWSFSTNQFWRASPMTYVFDGKQHIAIASGPNIIAFSLAK
jgi:alcohol dehydrogenase (cytochrome c)